MNAYTSLWHCSNVPLQADRRLEILLIVLCQNPTALATTFPIDTSDANSQNDLAPYSSMNSDFAVQAWLDQIPVSTVPAAVAQEKSSRVESPVLSPIASGTAWPVQFLEFDAFADQRISTMRQLLLFRVTQQCPSS